MNRYQTSTIVTDNTGVRSRSTVLLVAPPPSDQDIYIKTTSVERLDNLSYRFYDDVTYWWLIAAANGIGKGTMLVANNTKLRIPPKDGLADFISNINQTR